MKKPTAEQIYQMKQHPFYTAIVLGIELMILPFHILYTFTEKTITKLKEYGR